MAAWGFQYKSNIVWHKVRKDGGSDGRGDSKTARTGLLEELKSRAAIERFSV